MRQLKHGYTLLELMIVLAILVSIMAISWPRISNRMQLIAPREAALQLNADLAEAREQAVITGEAWVVRVERGSAKYEMGPVSTMRSEMLSTPAVNLLGGEDPFAEIVNTVDAGNSNTADASLASPSPTVLGASSTGTIVPPVQIRRHELPAGMVFDDGFAHQVSDVNAVRADPNQSLVPPPPPIGTPVTPGSMLANPMSLPTDPFQPSPLLSNAVDDKWKFAVIFQPDGRATDSEILLKEQATANKIRLRIRGFTGGVTIDKLERKPPNQPQMQSEDTLPNGEILDADLPSPLQPATPTTRSER